MIRRKLVAPATPADLVSRPRLDALIAELIDRQQVVRVCATAGAGKTTATAAALRSQHRPVAWLTVDHTDAAPGRLVTYLEAALSQVIPELAGTATRALAGGLPHVEAVGQLAEAVGDREIVFVLDDLERLGESRDPWAVIEAVVRYAPPALRIVLVSRRDIPTSVCPLPMDSVLASLGEDDLSFTTDEASQALAARQADSLAPAEVVEATGGWVTGVLFEAWRAEDHVVGTGGEADPLYGYLSTHILGGLSAAEREFLEVTSLLDEVTAARGEALGFGDAGERLHALRSAHLPVSWDRAGRLMRCHPRFREYLLDRLYRRPGPELRRLRLLHARLLDAEGYVEEATEEFLRADEPEAARPVAERAILQVIERLDFDVAQRWIAALAQPAAAGPLTTAELMIAVARDDYRRAVRIADDLHARGERDRLAASSALAAALMGWCYLHLTRIDDTHAVLGAAPAGPEVDAVRYCGALLVDFAPDHPPALPETTGGPLDALPFAASWSLGRLAELVEAPASPWAEAVSRPYRIAALRALGRTQQALELYQVASSASHGPKALHVAIGPEVLIDSGQLETARRAVAHGRRIALDSGSLGLLATSVVVAMKFALRMDHDPAAARALYDQLDEGGRRFRQAAEQLDMWYAFALLLQQEDEQAATLLQRAVQSMRAGDRILELPTAAVYLAEARWRAGDEEAADEAADLALETARRLGSNHVLLQALADFPAVASRRIDAEARADSEWHELGRSLIVQGFAVSTPIRIRLRLKDFGTVSCWAGDTEISPGLSKSYELLAYLGHRRGRPVSRAELLDALFDGRSDSSARSYLRQALLRLRNSLPAEVDIAARDDTVELGPEAVLSCDSTGFESRLVEAARLHGDARLQATIEALSRYEQGPYLAGVDSGWVAQRREQLDRLATDARYEAAELALARDRLPLARRLTEETLRVDPYREGAWRLAMRLAHALGDESGVVTAYKDCERILGELSTGPSATTRALLAELRR